jgi:hypothetical protein
LLLIQTATKKEGVLKKNIKWKKKAIGFILAAAVFFITVSLATVTWADEDEQTAEEATACPFVQLTKTLTMEPPAEMEAKQGPVTWPHLAHAMQYGCSICHHKWQPEEEALPQKCFTCHNNENQQGAPNFFVAFHDRKSDKSCLGCHSALKKENPETPAPLVCTQCHVRPDNE